MNNVIQYIKDFIKSYDPTKTMPAKTKNNFSKFLEDIKNDPDNKLLEENELSELIEILSKKKIDKKIKTQIKDKTEKLLFILEKKTKDTQYENNDELNDEENTEIITNNIKDYTKEDELINSTISQYNKYTEQNPMNGISYDKSINTYVLRYNSKKIKCKKIEILAEKMLNFLGDKKSEKILQIVPKEIIIYKGKKILIFNTIEEPLFDILHIIALLNIEGKYFFEKYNEFKNKISHYGFTKNKYNGYIVREFIPEETLYKIIMTSNSEFSSKFVDDIAIILKKLRKTGNLVIEDDTLNIRDNQIEKIDGKYKYNKTNIDNIDVKNKFNQLVKNNDFPQVYDNPLYREMINQLIIDGSKITVQNYVNTHIMYFFIVTIIDPCNTNRIFCKIGYTADIINRFKSLRDEYKCGFFLVDLRTVKSEKDEKNFHKLIKEVKPHLQFNMTVNNKEKEEVYIFDEYIYEQFKAMKEYDIQKNDDVVIDRYIEKALKDQYSYFLRYLNTFTTFSLLNVMTKIQNFTDLHRDTIVSYFTMNNNYNITELSFRDKDKEREHEIKINKIKYDHETHMKEHETHMKEHETHMNEQIITQRKLELEIAKLKH
jgi:hypothetical protein